MRPPVDAPPRRARVLARVLARTVVVLVASVSLAAPVARGQGAAEGELCRLAQRRGARGTEARDRVQGLAQSGGTAAFYQGCLLLADADWPKAADAFERAAAANDGSAEAHYFLGVAYGEQAQRANVLRQASLAGKTRKHFERAVQLDPDHIDARAALMQYFLVAPGILGGDEGKAREQAREIQRRNAYRGGFAFASIAAREKDWAAAAREYEQLAKQYPESAATWTSLAAAYGQQKRWGDAFGTVDRFLAAQPTSMVAPYALGRLAAESGEQLDRGAQALERYLQHTPAPNEPPLANAHLRLGQIEEKRGRKDAARLQYEQAIALDGRLKAAKDGLERVRR